MWGMPKCAAISAPCVPLPAPGGAIISTRILISSPHHLARRPPGRHPGWPQPAGQEPRSGRATAVTRGAPASSLAPPPCAFERPISAARAVERVELGDVLVRQPEVEKLGVLGDALAVGRLGDDRDAPLDAPAQQHLGGSAPVASRDPRDLVAAEVASGSQRAVGLQRDPVLAARLEQSPGVLVGTGL